VHTGVERPGRGHLSTTAAADGGLDEAVRSAQLGNEQAFMAVYRAIHPGLVRYLRTLVGQDGEDVASETWAHVCRDLTKFRGDGNGFRGWVATIGRNRAIDHLRAHGRRPLESVDPATLREVAGAHDTAGQAVDAVGTAHALSLIAALPPDQAEAVLLRVVMGLDAKTAAAVLGKRPGAVRTSAYRGLRALARVVEAGQQ
jgi:RNA polymerase sigma-70 factor (ECF subfamily)